MTGVVVERFFLVDRISCPCAGPVIISPVFGSDTDRLFAVARHERSPEHRYYRARSELDTAYYDPPETPLTPSVVEPPGSIEESRVGPDGEPGVTTRGVGTRPLHSGGVSIPIPRSMYRGHPGRHRRDAPPMMDGHRAVPYWLPVMHRRMSVICKDCRQVLTGDGTRADPWRHAGEPREKGVTG